MLRYKINFFRSIFLVAFVFLYVRGNAQSDNVDFQTWTDFTFTSNIKNNIVLGGDMGIRGLVSGNNWNQFYIRPGIQYSFNSTVQVATGVAIFNTRSAILDNTFELRFYQETNVSWPTFDYIHFSHRVRFEERIFTYQKDNTIGLDLPTDFEARARYQLSLETDDIKPGNSKRPIYFMGGWELFYALNGTAIESFINNQRFIGGIGHRVNPRFKYEIQYIYQKSRRLTEDGPRTSEHLLRLRLSLLPKRTRKSSK